MLTKGLSYKLCLHLHQEGLRPAAISERLGISRQRVYQLLGQANVDPKQTKARDIYGFVFVWESSASIDEVAQTMGMSRNVVSSKARHLRYAGVKLKHFCGTPRIDRDVVRTLLRYGMSAKQVSDTCGISVGAVHGEKRKTVAA